jgi:hypothetical protein
MDAARLQALIDQRTKAAAEADAVAEKAEGRDFTAEEVETRSRVAKDIAGLNAKIKEGVAEMRREQEFAASMTEYRGLRGNATDRADDKPNPRAELVAEVVGSSIPHR